MYNHILVLLVCIISSIQAIRPGHRSNEPKKAVCIMDGPEAKGEIYLEKNTVDGSVSITGQIDSLSPGKHGFHIHQFGDVRNGCTNAGGHYNPFNKQHGAPTDSNRHVGDLGNIEADQTGKAVIRMVTQVKLCGPLSVVGRAIVVHGREDDLGRGGNDESLKTGNAGPRVGCCVIGYQQA